MEGTRVGGLPVYARPPMNEEEAEILAARDERSAQIAKTARCAQFCPKMELAAKSIRKFERHREPFSDEYMRGECEAAQANCETGPIEVAGQKNEFECGSTYEYIDEIT